MVGVETQTHTAGPPQTRTSWCARTGQWGWAAAPRSRSWCSGWRSSSERGTAWTSPVSASPTASPGPPPRSQRTSGARLWPAPRPTSSPFWERGGDTGADVHGTKPNAWWIAVANADGNVCSPGVQRVSEDVQAAHHHCRVTSWKRNVCGRCGQRSESKSKHRGSQRKPYQREKSCVWQELPAYRTGWERKTARKELNKKSFRENKDEGK